MSFFDLSIFDHKSISLASISSENGGAIESEVQSFSEFTAWVTEESDLRMRAMLVFDVTMEI